MGQHGVQTVKNSNLPPAGAVKLNSGVRNSSQVNRTVVHSENSAKGVNAYHIQSQVKQDLMGSSVGG